MAKLADARDLKSRAPKRAYRFDSDPGHQQAFLLKILRPQLRIAAAGSHPTNRKGGVVGGHPEAPTSPTLDPPLRFRFAPGKLYLAIRTVLPNIPEFA